MTKNTPKKRTTQARLVQKNNRYIIFWMLPGAQTVQMYFKAELWAPEVDPGFEKKIKRKLRCQKEQARPQFSKYRFQNATD